MSDPGGPLGRCIGDVDRFATENWGRLPLLCRRRGSFDDLLSSAAIAELLELSARRPTMRMVDNGRTIAPSEYTKTVRMGGAWVSEVADADRIARQLALGVTLVLQNLERVHPPLREFTHELQCAISHPVQANAYLSPPNASGLARHDDSHDVIVIQLEGVKSWDIDGVGLIDLSPGDVVYIPRGCSHEASTATRHSLHLTIGIFAVTVGDVVRRALSSTSVDFRRSLPLGYASLKNGQGLTDTIAESFESVARDMSSRDYGEVARSEQTRVEESLRRSHTLRAQLDAFVITDDTRLHRILELSLRVIDDRAVLSAGDLELRMPRSTIDALRTLVSHTTITVGQLTGLNEASRLVLARRLLREGVVAIDARTDSPSLGVTHDTTR